MSTDEYFMESEEEAQRLDLKTDPKVVDRHARWAGLQPGMRVADLGCGSGQILNDLVDQFEEQIRLDVSRKIIKKYNKRDLLCIEADLNSRFPLQDGVADAVIANQVIEHIVDPLHQLISQAVLT